DHDHDVHLGNPGGEGHPHKQLGTRPICQRPISANMTMPIAGGSGSWPLLSAPLAARNSRARSIAGSARDRYSERSATAEWSRRSFGSGSRILSIAEWPTLREWELSTVCARAVLLKASRS